jgi:uncharacterized protein with HEPN domain
MQPDEVSVRDLIRECTDALSFVHEMTWEEFRGDLRTQKAVLHCLMIMGEAVKRLSDEVRGHHPAIAWSQIAGMRDIFIHAYHRVELAQVWNIMQTDIPSILAYLQDELLPGEFGAELP